MSIDAYLRAIADVHSSGLGTPELSYYPAVSNLLNEIGERLQPRVRCIMNLQSAGAGLPDGGAFSGSRSAGSGVEAAVPDRAAIEVKPPGDKLDDDIVREQIDRYTMRYGLVLATDLREWRLVELRADNSLSNIDSFKLADDANKFWNLCVHPGQLTAEAAVEFEDFLIRSLLRGAPLYDANDVALLMASYAREARRRLGTNNPPALKTLKGILEEALGTKFERRDGDAFFRSTLIQTLFYGVFSAWVIWCREPARNEIDQFNWHDTEWKLRVPMVRALFERIATPTVLGPLHLASLMDSVEESLNRILRKKFFDSFDAGHVVQHFYEPFLRAFDPVLRKKMGVWFTPPELVEYMVRRVDSVLRDHLGVSGLDDSRVHVLDPCVGTGSFLVAVMRLIVERAGKSPGTPLVLKEAVLSRLHGFELLPAPYVVAHLQIGMLLQIMGAPFSDDGKGNGERARVYLTNSLTGWSEQDMAQLPIAEFEEERDAANDVKRDVPIWVIIGNPPYDGFSGVSPREEQGLIDAYKDGLRALGITKHKLDDPYIRFFRIAENRVAHHSPFQGVVCYVSNYSFVSHKSAAMVRRSLLASFDKIWVDDLHGNRGITEYGPDGRTSETIFSLDGYSPGIKQGVVTSLWLRNNTVRTLDGEVFYREDFDASRAADRRHQMLSALRDADFEEQYRRVDIEAERYYSFKPATALAQYIAWPSVEQLAEYDSSLGPNDNRRGALMDSDRSVLEARMRAYFSDSPAAEVSRLGGAGIVSRAARFTWATTRDRLRVEGYQAAKLRRFLYRPFDLRWAYLTGEKLWNEGRTDYFSWAPEGTYFVMYRRNGVDENDGSSLMLTHALGDQHALHKDAYFIPYVITPPEDAVNPVLATAASVNLSAEAVDYLGILGLSANHGHRTLWAHALAIAFCGSYQRENSGLLVQRPPRIPLPNTRAALEASAMLGERLTALLDMATPVTGVTNGELSAELSRVGVLSRTDPEDMRPLRPRDLEVRVGWGRLGGNGVVPGRGKVVRYAAEEPAVEEADLSEDEPGDADESATFDICLNESVRWRNIPGPVWTYRVAGYRVLKKWLSYREWSVIRRPLSIKEAQEFTSIARRIAAILKLEPTLTLNYETVKSDVYTFPALRSLALRSIARRKSGRKIGKSPASSRKRTTKRRKSAR